MTKTFSNALLSSALCACIKICAKAQSTNNYSPPVVITQFLTTILSNYCKRCPDRTHCWLSLDLSCWIVSQNLIRGIRVVFCNKLADFFSLYKPHNIQYIKLEGSNGTMRCRFHLSQRTTSEFSDGLLLRWAFDVYF